MAFDPTSPAPFGHMLDRDGDPFTADGEVDYDGVARPATHLSTPATTA